MVEGQDPNPPQRRHTRRAPADLRGGVVGRPHRAQMDRRPVRHADTRRLPAESRAPGARPSRDRTARGPLLDLGTYAVTLATWTLGAPDAVVAVAKPAPTGVNGQLAIAMSTPAGGTASLHTKILADSTTTREHHRHRGRVEPQRRYYLPGRMTVHQRSGQPQSWVEPMVEHDALHFEAAELARRIAAGESGSPLRPWADTVGTLEVMDRVRVATGLDFAEARAHRDE